MGTRSSFRGGKAVGRKADHLPRANAEVKNGGLFSPWRGG
jgi:hypothetical protein